MYFSGFGGSHGRPASKFCRVEVGHTVLLQIQVCGVLFAGHKAPFVDLDCGRGRAARQRRRRAAAGRGRGSVWLAGRPVPEMLCLICGRAPSRMPRTLVYPRDENAPVLCTVVPPSSAPVTALMLFSDMSAVSSMCGGNELAIQSGSPAPHASCSTRCKRNSCCAILSQDVNMTTCIKAVSHAVCAMQALLDCL